jgi:hypothetical protein
LMIAALLIYYTYIYDQPWFWGLFL